MVNIGIIGLGPVWESRYAPVLQKFRERIRLRAVYDPVADRAEQVAENCDALPMRGVQTLLDRPDVKAVLLLDTAWHGHRSIEFACTRSKSTYIAGRLGDDTNRLARLYKTGRSLGLTLMPELSWRYTPATGRLQELMATQLGKPRRILVEAQHETPAASMSNSMESHYDPMVGLIDWCRYVARAPVVSVEMCEQSADDQTVRPARLVTIRFAPPRSGGEGAVAELRLFSSTASADSPTVITTHREIQCDNGVATIKTPTDISWQSAAGPVSEILTADRSEVEVMLDHFCRRVAGGLIPVADIDDICRSLTIVAAAEKSLISGAPVQVRRE